MSRKLSKELWETLKAVSYVIGSHEQYDEEHTARLAGHACLIGEKMALDPEETEQLEYAVLLHDIGQIIVRETILKKPGKLTRDEFHEMQAHTIESEKIINMMPKLGWAAQWARWHHEWWDGSGYPDRLAGEAIPLPSRILAVVDAFGAMLCDRPYRPAMTREEAIAELKLMSGIQFDPKIVSIFERTIDGKED